MGRLGQYIGLEQVNIGGGLEIITCDTYNSAGISSTPLSTDTVALISTEAAGGYAVVGSTPVIEKITLPGETIIFARQESGVEISSIYLKADNSIEIKSSIGLYSLLLNADGSLEYQIPTGSPILTINASGITSTVPIIAPEGTFGGKVVSTHDHSGVKAGGDVSGPPV